ncbi:phosphomethylpyrimidine kinase [Spizellomyces punctatus DAOM BR117]|uniref:Phosphomethylpyrimidine kinase n=1 Tax=Spizellomyces punctatus (strain DAOM BR117) TaxID=645134 RepID=A0A0L0HF74_SPIPD|nr:phosphomethylpyrimidine kinase [Spizellomyces punctatus DAOM BR117]KNC99691.1 phosphomethylpyrimidine kinase [Spizellomyces punctatus DAOM BR117]|eukprot:XP_016607731.1 phosphomethylpyrimidine kinase [Spizellomyces punctatus DAOM BR117]
MLSARQNVPKALTVAGSDSGGGAGIQADLKTFNTLSVYGASVLTAITAQNTVGVQGIYALPVDFVEQQMESVLDDITFDAVKTGMLLNAEIIENVSRLFKSRSINHLVVDPVMVSTSGSRLLAENAIFALRKHLLPLAEIVTPNISEAEVLAEMKIKSLMDARDAARKLHTLGCKNVLVKGGHMPVDGRGNPVDVQLADGNSWVVDTLFDGDEFVEFRNRFVATENTHGTGCTLSAAITAGLAKGLKVRDSVEKAMLCVSKGLASSFSIGKGGGPLNHFPPVMNLSSEPSYRGGSFVQLLKSAYPQEWSDYVNHEFVRKLADGSLPIECFKHYIRQDYIFLRHYARANALASYREHDMDDIIKAAQIVTYIGMECQMHVKYCADWGISVDDLEATREATPNLAYTRYVLDRGMSGDRLDLRVALAPCLLGYGEVGVRLANDPATKREGNPYWTWIQNYAKDEFQAAVREGEELLEKLFDDMVPPTNHRRIKQLCDTFRQATILERNFWEMGLSLVP